MDCSTGVVSNTFPLLPLIIRRPVYDNINIILLKKFNLPSRGKGHGQVQWRWNDTGEPFSAKPKMFNIVHVEDARNLVQTGPIKEYCFLVTNDTFLEIENCSENHAYICERSEGKELSNLLYH